MKINVVLTHKLFFSKKTKQQQHGRQKKNPTFLAQNSSTPFTFPNITRWCIGQIQEVSKKGFFKMCKKGEGNRCVWGEALSVWRTHLHFKDPHEAQKSLSPMMSMTLTSHLNLISLTLSFCSLPSYAQKSEWFFLTTHLRDSFPKRRIWETKCWFCRYR